MLTNYIKYSFLAVLFLSVTTDCWAQKKYITQSGTITFFSETPVENIEAVNNQVSSVLNMENGEMAFSLLMKAFSFEKALMEEHFNEKYIESNKYPKATFKGSIQNFETLALSNESTRVKVNGILEIRKKQKEINTEVTLKKDENAINGTCSFNINLEDFEIKIPSAVRDNIAKTIEITVLIDYVEM